jgi:hypothetical protein
MRVRWLDGLVLLYGIILIASGIYGYLLHNSNSTAALIGRCAAGAIVIGLAAYTRTNPRMGRIGVAVISLLTFGHTLQLYFEKHSKTGLAISIISLLVFVCLLGGHFAAMKKKKSGL